MDFSTAWPETSCRFGGPYAEQILESKQPNHTSADFDQRSIMLIRVTAALILLAITSGSVAASFNCDKATTKVEGIICSDPEISRLDEQLSEIYAQRVAESPYYRQSQRDWISVRNTCEDRECVLGLYVRRINFLLPPDRQLAYPETPNPPLAASNEPYAPAYAERDVESSIDAEVPPSAQASAAQEVPVEEQAASDSLFSESLSQGNKLEAVTTSPQPAGTDAIAVKLPQRATASELEAPRLVLLVILAIVIGFVSIVALSCFGKIVFYFDGRDFIWSLSPAIAAALTGIVVAILHGEDSNQFTMIQKTAIALGCSVALLGVWMAFYNAVRYNRSLVIGLLVGTCKTLAAAFMVFSFFANSGRKHSRDYYKNSESGRRERAIGRSSFVILGLLWFALVNGERTYENKGWELPAA